MAERLSFAVSSLLNCKIELSYATLIQTLSGQGEELRCSSLILLIAMIDEMSDDIIYGLHNAAIKGEKSRRGEKPFGNEHGSIFIVAVVADKYLAGFADVGGDSSQIRSGEIFGNGDGIFAEPTETEGFGLLNPSDAYFYIALQISGIHFFSAFRTVHLIALLFRIL